MLSKKDQLLQIFKHTGALQEGHFELSSGLHSPKYFQCAKVLQYPELCHEIGVEMGCQLKEKNFIFDTIISPAIGGILIGQKIAEFYKCRHVFTERPKKEMELRRGFKINHGERFLIVEDVITTGGSVKEIMVLIKAQKGTIAGISSIVDRSTTKIDFDGLPFLSLLKVEAVEYLPNSKNCPGCANNIPLVKPGSNK